MKSDQITYTFLYLPKLKEALFCFKKKMGKVSVYSYFTKIEYTNVKYRSISRHKMDAHANSSQLEILAFLSAELDQKKEKQTARKIS